MLARLAAAFKSSLLRDIEKEPDQLVVAAAALLDRSMQSNVWDAKQAFAAEASAAIALARYLRQYHPDYKDRD